MMDSASPTKRPALASLDANALSAAASPKATGSPVKGGGKLRKRALDAAATAVMAAAAAANKRPCLEDRDRDRDGVSGGARAVLACCRLAVLPA